MNENLENAKKKIDSLVERTKGAIGMAAGSAEESVVAAADDIVNRTHEAGIGLRESSQAAASDAHRLLDTSAKAIDRGYTRARAEVSRAATAAAGFASENPRTTVLFAASAGFVLGVLVQRRMRA